MSCRGRPRIPAGNRCILPADPSPSATRTLPHGARELRCARLDDYNVELREDGGFLGDRANKKAFQALFDRWREALGDADPLRDVPTEDLYKEKQELARLHPQNPRTGPPWS